jgi:hypothetical protein
MIQALVRTTSTKRNLRYAASGERGGTNNWQQRRHLHTYSVQAGHDADGDGQSCRGRDLCGSGLFRKLNFTPILQAAKYIYFGSLIPSSAQPTGANTILRDHTDM